MSHTIGVGKKPEVVRSPQTREPSLRTEPSGAAQVAEQAADSAWQLAGRVSRDAPSSLGGAVAAQSIQGKSAQELIAGVQTRRAERDPKPSRARFERNVARVEEHLRRAAGEAPLHYEAMRAYLRARPLPNRLRDALWASFRYLRRAPEGAAFSLAEVWSSDSAARRAILRL